MEDLLRRCYGMRSARLDASGNVVEDTVRDEPASIDFSRFSRLVRVPGVGGGVAQVPRAHGMVQAVRVFPRRFDAHLLAAIAALPAGVTAGPGAITGRYRWQASAVSIVDLRVDGVAQGFEVAFTPRSPDCAR
ncbi:MAG: hypothetical protein HQ495_16515 [Alphaproteobacteria bacterium]|nr:hypothetical protein [Alphaproteobacteria bacterium]